jgi:hypothetical protein
MRQHELQRGAEQRHIANVADGLGRFLLGLGAGFDLIGLGAVRCTAASAASAEVSRRAQARAVASSADWGDEVVGRDRCHAQQSATVTPARERGHDCA